MTGNLHILLIDDDPIVNMLNRIIIEKSPLQADVTVTTEARKALEQLAAGQINPSLILLDLNMPVMDGWMFLEGYEQLPGESKGTKIIILSSSINPVDIEKAKASSAVTDFFRKPLSIDSVKEIQALLMN